VAELYAKDESAAVHRHVNMAQEATSLILRLLTEINGAYRKSQHNKFIDSRVVSD
jgi:hypothetical protein